MTAFRLASRPPAIFENPPSPVWSVILAVVTLLVVAAAAATRRYLLVALLFVGGVVVGLAMTPVEFGSVVPRLPDLVAPAWSAAGTAFVLLVIPQLPLTYGNAIVGVTHLAREQFGEAARRVTPGRVALTCGLGNLASAAIGGMPMCHGSSGFTAHVRLGARHPAMNLVLGLAFLITGLVFADQVLALFGLLPVWTLAGFLGYAGIRHAWLVRDLGGSRLWLALSAGSIGVATGNLAVTTAVALIAEHGPGLWRRVRRRLNAPADGSRS